MSIPLALAAALVLPALQGPLPAISPSDANRALEMTARVAVTRDGRAQSCVQLVRSIDPAFDVSACHALRQASFTPARGADGKAVAGAVDLGLRYAPGRGIESFAAPDTDLNVKALPAGVGEHPITRLALALDGRGQVTGCDVIASSGDPGLDAAACRAGPKAAGVGSLAGAGLGGASVQSLNVGFGAYDVAVFRKDGRYPSLGDAGPYYPGRADRLGLSGDAVVSCTAAADGALSGCEVREAYPAGAEFDLAALRMAKEGWMKAAPGADGRRVLLRVDFPPDPHFRH